MEYLNLFVQVFAFMSAMFVMVVNIKGTFLVKILLKTSAITTLFFLGIIWLKGLEII